MRLILRIPFTLILVLLFLYNQSVQSYISRFRETTFKFYQSEHNSYNPGLKIDSLAFYTNKIMKFRYPNWTFSEPVHQDETIKVTKSNYSNSRAYTFKLIKEIDDSLNWKKSIVSWSFLVLLILSLFIYKLEDKIIGQRH
jgi:hypothetical protein